MRGAHSPGRDLVAFRRLHLRPGAATKEGYVFVAARTPASGYDPERGAFFFAARVGLALAVIVALDVVLATSLDAGSLSPQTVGRARGDGR